MRINTKAGILDITLRSLDEPIQGDLAFVDKASGVLVDIVFISHTGVERYPVSGFIEWVVKGVTPEITFGDTVFYFVTGSMLKHWWANLSGVCYTERGDLKDKYPSFEMPTEAPDGVVADIYDIFPELRKEVKWRRKMWGTVGKLLVSME